MVAELVKMVHRNGRRVDFAAYAASVFNPYLFHGSYRSQRGCGASALALLTGVAPEIIASENGRPHYSDHFMLQFLRAREFRTLHLTPRNVTTATKPIGTQHVVLLSQLFKKKEGTWGVLFGDTYYHNFDLYALTALAFLNKPILTAYVVIHPKWQIDRSAGAPSPKLPPLRRRLTLNALCKRSALRGPSTTTASCF